MGTLYCGFLDFFGLFDTGASMGKTTIVVTVLGQVDFCPNHCVSPWPFDALDQRGGGGTSDRPENCCTRLGIEFYTQ